jgi:hypothetical protein
MDDDLKFTPALLDEIGKIEPDKVLHRGTSIHDCTVPHYISRHPSIHSLQYASRHRLTSTCSAIQYRTVFCVLCNVYSIELSSV